MNKKLLTAAIGAALAMGATAASADVKLYGKIHVSVDYLDGQTTTATNSPHHRKSTNITNNTSRWGLDVSEKLGGGLTAIGKLESQIDATGDNSTDTATPQNRFVGMSGGFGTILAGVHDTPYKELMGATNLFTDQVGDSRNIIRQNGAGGSSGILRTSSYDWDARTANAIRYQSPSMAGFKLTYLWSADVTTSTTSEDNRRKASSLSVGYSSGPLYVAYAQESHQLAVTTSLLASDPVETGQRLAASYSFGSLKVTGLYQRLKNLGGQADGDQKVDRNAWGLGAAYTAGNNVFKAQYYTAGKFNQKANSALAGDVSNTGANNWALGWDHLFSKTTKAYVAYSKTTNQDNMSMLVNAGGHGDQVTPGTGQDPSVWSVGMVLDF